MRPSREGIRILCGIILQAAYRPREIWPSALNLSTNWRRFTARDQITAPGYDSHDELGFPGDPVPFSSFNRVMVLNN